MQGKRKRRHFHPVEVYFRVQYTGEPDYGAFDDAYRGEEDYAYEFVQDKASQ